jgi:hypothetical protein
VGYIAVASDARDSVKIQKCHLNVWSLPLLFGRRSTLLDIGLALEVHESIDRLTVAVPGSIVDDRIEDLYERMREPRVAGLIFAADPTIKGDLIDWGIGDHRLAQLDLTSCQPSKPDHRQFSAWRVAFAEPLSPGDRYYTRFRIHLRPSPRMIGGGRWPVLRRRLTIDLRLADWREAWTVGDAGALTRQIVPIAHADVFVIVPMVYSQAEISPTPKYIRLLEGAVWESYLRRATNLRRTQKLVIYRWSNDDISAEEPFRGFLRLTRPPRILLLSVATAVLSAAVVGGAFTLTVRPWLSNSADWLADEAVTIFYAIVGLSIFALLNLVLRLFGWARRAHGWVARRFRAAELALFRSAARY